MKTYVRAIVFLMISGLAAIGFGSDIQISTGVLYPYQSSLEVQEEFTSGTAVTQNVGAYGFGAGNGTIAIITSEANRPGIYQRGTSAVSGTLAVTQLWPHSSALFEANLPHTVLWAVRLNTNDANTTMRFGVGNSIVANPPSEGIYFEKLDGDTNWFCITRTTSLETRTDSTIAVNTSFNEFKYRRTSGQVDFLINGTQVCSHTTRLSSALVDPFTQIVNSAAADKTMDLDYFQLQLTGLTR